MKRTKENMNNGLTREEFELIISKSNNPEVISNYESSLDNCDLSRSAIELIREDDLYAINRITSKILLKYPTDPHLGSGRKFLVIGMILIISTFVIFIFFGKDIRNSNGSKNSTEIKKTKIENLKNPKSFISLSEKELSLTSRKTSGSKNDTVPSPEFLSKDIEQDEISTSTLKPIQESKKNIYKTPKKNYLKKIRAVKSVKRVPEKYKSTLSSLINLVKFHGGDENLEKTIFSTLKGKIKDEYLPQKNTSIIFKFKVTNEGTVKDINVQSVVNLKLEELIKKTAINLTSWVKGNAIIPVIYTVYITYQ